MRTYDLPKKLADKAMREADQELMAQHRKGNFDEGDPNNPKYNNGYNYANPMLFGYTESEFLAKQYR